MKAGMGEPKLPAAELYPAYVWDCPECGRENFQRSISRVLDPDDDDDREVIQGLYGPGALDEAEGGRRVRSQTTPNSVVCRHCAATFRAVNDLDVPDDDDFTGDDTDD